MTIIPLPSSVIDASLQRLHERFADAQTEALADPHNDSWGSGGKEKVLALKRKLKRSLGQ